MRASKDFNRGVREGEGAEFTEKFKLGHYRKPVMLALVILRHALFAGQRACPELVGGIYALCRCG